MEIVSSIVVAVVSVLMTLYWQKYRQQSKQTAIKTSYGRKVVKNTSKLSNHSSDALRKEVLKIGSNIYVAKGFGLANCIMIEGEDGVVIIDTMESNEAARDVKEEFQKITTKPVVGIILTHFHADHAYGTEEFLAGTDKDSVEIFAHSSFPQYYRQVMDVRSPITFKRAVRQFGTEVPMEIKENAGIGLFLRLDNQSRSYVFPTKTFTTTLSISLAGLDLELIHAPGETNDQIIVWYPAKETLFPADNIYKAFPNLYAIRGCMHRDTLLWARAVDTMIDLSPAVLVPQHTQPIEGREKILDTLTAYRDAIQFVHDQTVRYMNKGMSGREIAETVKLPAHLATHPYLIEYYGTVEWSVRSVYHGYMGWFSGRPGDLHPLPRREEAEKWVELGGGEGGVLTRAELAVEQGEFQWGLQLTDCLADCGKDSDRSKELRGICLRELASREVSAPGMNWYLTEDMVQQGLEIKPNWNVTASHIQRSDVRGLFRILTVMLDSEATLDITCTAVFKFLDTSESVTIMIRRGVCLLPTTTPDTSDIEVQTTTQVWKDVVAKKRTALAASLTGDIKVIPGIQSLSTFFGYFDTEQA